ncbi:YqzL family protein [Aneurinibacillus sp. Ricciae_BoGa-3]|nr:YqzL family protein [Aneurinibacillus sp. Ricciae_BoGa-3]WCK53461.1 YqzL family protein [Aneurinibacillus sp. Ricciae_BoGa-3]
MIKDFSWNYFKMTGSLDAYMLYTEHKNYLDLHPMEEALQDQTEEPLNI